MAHNTKQIKTVIDLIAKEQKLKKYVYEKKTLSSDVINFMANLTPASLKDEVTGEVLNVIIKIAPYAPLMDDVLREFYNREVYFYNTLVPIVKNNTSVKLQGFIPECYYANASNRVLALEDMTIQGFKRHEKGMYLNQEHITATLRALAKFHSLSMIINEKHIKLPNDDRLKPFSAEYPEFYCKAQRFLLGKYLYLFKGMKCKNIINYLYREINNSTEFLNGIVPQARCLVYGHGDLWKENILFKYSDQDSAEPIELCLVDFQMTRLMCPAAEVLFFIMNSAESSVRRQHFKTFISTYHNTLRDSITDSGVNPEGMYSQEDLHFDLKLVSRSCFSLLFLSFLLWLRIEVPETVIRKSEDLPDRQSEAVINFKGIIECLVNDLTEFGLIDQQTMP